MRLAVSNLAWRPEEAERAYALLAEEGVGGLEIAPTLAFPDAADPLAPDASELADFLRRTGRRGLATVSMQSLLFGRDGARLFGTEAARAEFEDGIGRAVALAGRLRIPNLVLGSPVQRRIPEGVARPDAERIARDALRRLGDRAQAAGATLALEPNPAAYGANFLVTLEEAFAFVEAVDHPAVTLNFDLGALRLDGEEHRAERLFRRCAARISHVHLSEPHLAPVPQDAGATDALLRRLRGAGRRGWISIEMRAVPGDGLEAVRRAVRACAASLEARAA